MWSDIACVGEVESLGYTNDTFYSYVWHVQNTAPLYSEVWLLPVFWHTICIPGVYGKFESKVTRPPSVQAGVRGTTGVLGNITTTGIRVVIYEVASVQLTHFYWRNFSAN